MIRQKTSEVYLNILFMAFLAIFLKFWEPGLGNSTTGYGSLAWNILKDGQWFHVHMAPDFFNPFVDHPYLIIWIDAFLFKIFGVSAQTVRLASSFSGLAIFSLLFFLARRFFDERVAVFSVLSLVLINPFMNFTSSGWLDMPMIGLVWAGVWLSFYGVVENRNSKLFWGAVFFGLAVLAKGVCALGVFAPAFWVYWKCWKQKRLDRILWYSAAVFLPVVVFTALHYHAEGFVFWKKYLFREAVEQTLENPERLTLWDYFWYVRAAFSFGHLVTILGFAGVYSLWKNNRKDWALLILAQFVIHSLGYSWSTRHYSQYTLPIFPWLALSCGYVVARRVTWSALAASKVGMRFALFLFVALDILPIRVHSGNENPFRSFQTTLRQMKDNRHVYFVGKYSDQSTWEDPTSYIVWYWERIPFLTNFEGVFHTLNQDDPEALGLVSTEQYEKNPEITGQFPDVTVCMHNDLLTVLARKKICSEKLKTFRFRESAKTFYQRGT